MRFTLHWFDVAPYRDGSVAPQFTIERPLPSGRSANAAGMFAAGEVSRLGEFWVPTLSIYSARQEWSVTKSGQYVRVPILAYRTKGRTLPHILATGLSLGLEVLRTAEFDTSRIGEITIVLGNECTDLAADEAFRCYVGMAFRLG